jgi:hypothetical protein
MNRRTNERGLEARTRSEQIKRDDSKGGEDEGGFQGVTLSGEGEHYLPAK